MAPPVAPGLEVGLEPAAGLVVSVLLSLVAITVLTLFISEPQHVALFMNYIDTGSQRRGSWSLHTGADFLLLLGVSLIPY